MGIYKLVRCCVDVYVPVPVDNVDTDSFKNVEDLEDEIKSSTIDSIEKLSTYKHRTQTTYYINQLLKCMKMIAKIKEILKDRFYGDLVFAIGVLLIGFIMVDGFYYLVHYRDKEELKPIPIVKVVNIPISTVYGILYKDGTRGKVTANSFIWDNGKINFYVNDTLVVKTISSALVDSVYIYK